MGVEARDVRAVVAPHGPELDDDILQDLVLRGANVDVAIAVGRSVVEDIAGPSPSSLPHQPVDIELVPLLNDSRLTLRKVRPHGEVGLG